MKAATAKDTTERTIVINVVDGPVLDVTQSWHRRPRLIRVERVTVQVLNGRVRELTALGGLVLKNGRTSLGQRDRRTWASDNDLPEWAQRFWNEAPDGVTFWADGNEEDQP
jgi:hypothetical protein